MTNPARVVRVAVIDSGVHADHPHVGGVAGGVGIAEDGRRHGDYVDRLGHGTAVAAAIREKAPAAELYCIKVFDRELASTGQALVSAIGHASEVGAHLINLSLGTSNRDHEAALQRAIDRAMQAGVIVIAAGEQDGVRWLPGCLPGVWQVLLDWSVPREECRVILRAGSTPVCRASGYPRPIPGVAPERNLKGLSFAVANVSGLVAAALSVPAQGN
jgi:subtilisin family serine protease